MTAPAVAALVGLGCCATAIADTARRHPRTGRATVLVIVAIWCAGAAWT